METDQVEPWIIDCDTGVDDTFAIMQLLGRPDKIKLVAITTVNGNTRLDHVINNVLKTLEFLNREVDVYVGCDEPLVCEKLTVEHNFHGDDGWGDVEEFKSSKGFRQCLKENEHAVEALIRFANEYKGKLNILAIGPSTNIAVACRLDPTFSSKIGKFITMGGAHWGMGNVSCTGEHNVYSDPDAFKVCLDEFQEKMVLVTWECTFGHDFLLEDHVALFDSTKKYGVLLEKITKDIRGKMKGHLGQMCDLMSAVLCIDQSIIKKEVITYVDVERHSPETQGQTLILWPNNFYFRKMKREELAKLPKIKVVLETDVDKTRNLFMGCLKNFT
jgi:purine nucleosidase